MGEMRKAPFTSILAKAFTLLSLGSAGTRPTAASVHQGRLGRRHPPHAASSGSPMSVVLRIFLFIGLIFWFSPLRPALEMELKALPKVPADAFAEVDLDRIGQLIRVLD